MQFSPINRKPQEYLENKQADGKIPFQVLPWASQSPDLNSIKHVWKKLKDALRYRRDRRSNSDQLWQFVQEEWDKLSKDFLQNLVSSLPRRMKALIKQRGGPTKY